MPPKQTPRKELDPQTRSRICELRSIGWSHRRIQSKYSDIPLGTIKTTINRERIRDNNTTRPRPGQPRRLTDEHRSRICELVKDNPDIKIDDLLKEVNHVVKKRSIQRFLQEMRARKK